MGIAEIRKMKFEADLPKPAKIYTIPKKSKKRMEKEKLHKDSDENMDRWFEMRRLEMIGSCANCGKKSCKDDDKWYRASIAHLLPKAYFPSVATHPDNFIELCFWGDNSCHTQMDNKILDMTDMACWDMIVERFLKVYPFVLKAERKRIPQILLNYIEVDI
jgi:hypothetical protein